MAASLIGSNLGEIQACLDRIVGPGVPAFRARQVYESIYKQRVTDASAIRGLPREWREKLAKEVAFGLPELDKRYQSADGTIRYLLRLDDGKTVETVLMPEGERYTFCISSQVGCPVNCQFCLTALMGLERNLTAGEIVGQILFTAAENGLSSQIAKLNVVMMGQGEPLLNLPNVLKAVRILADPDGAGLSMRRMTLSTSGIVPRIEELGREAVRPKLAISLNASTEEQRRELMPITKKYSLRDLMAVCKAYPLRSWEHLSFEYVLLRGVNDSDDDARRVARLIANLRCKVNLIALNPGPGIAFQTPDPERVAAFQAIVKRSAPCFVRKPRGRDIYAACGQLKRMADSSAFVELEAAAPGV
ncbi:MAG: 23S rRNA (adenine(2503)-C(2))-methyltransferase RlmN [Candidatus Solibacter usitatus]|nr:23S rRNA (adenine(2503)-C(2))-methyltransferase RlmN [Candidatus Solibacter usitatus]